LFCRQFLLQWHFYSLGLAIEAKKECISLENTTVYGKKLDSPPFKFKVVFGVKHAIIKRHLQKNNVLTHTSIHTESEESIKDRHKIECCYGRIVRFIRILQCL